MSEKILIIQTAFIGDAILTLPLVQKINEIYSNITIDVLTIQQNSLIFESSPFVNNVIIFNKRKEHKSIIKTIKLAKKLKSNNYTKVISPHRSFRTSLIVWALKVKNSVGFDISSMSFVYKKIVKYRLDYHEVQRDLSLLENDDLIKNWKILPVIKTERKILEKIQLFVKSITNRKIIAIAPASVWFTKTYPKDYFVKIINELIAKGFFIVLIGGENDKKYCCGIKNLYNDNIISTAGDFNIIETIELFKYCELLVCNDSAPTHMAMCANIPVLTIYCSTTPNFGFYPYNERSQYLSYEDLECKPCGIHGHKKCPIKTFRCAHLLSPQKIITYIHQMLNR
ncbi:MAG: glycosyltransferase family 9 protein [Ignavibacteriales bacterium]|nr:glycosyltransferase family 9 protein [Ignavibacteriales bacterium]